MCRHGHPRERGAEHHRSGCRRSLTPRPRPVRDDRRERDRCKDRLRGHGRLTRSCRLRRCPGHPGRNDAPGRRLEHFRRRGPRLVPARGPRAAAGGRLRLVAANRRPGSRRRRPAGDAGAGRPGRRRKLGSADREATACTGARRRLPPVVARRPRARSHARPRGLPRRHDLPDRLGRRRPGAARARRQRARSDDGADSDTGPAPTGSQPDDVSDDHDDPTPREAGTPSRPSTEGGHAQDTQAQARQAGQARARAHPAARRAAARRDAAAWPGARDFPVAGDVAWGDTYGALRSDVPGGWHHGDDLFAPLGTPSSRSRTASSSRSAGTPSGAGGSGSSTPRATSSTTRISPGTARSDETTTTSSAVRCSDSSATRATPSPRGPMCISRSTRAVSSTSATTAPSTRRTTSPPGRASAAWPTSRRPSRCRSAAPSGQRRDGGLQGAARDQADEGAAPARARRDPVEGGQPSARSPPARTPVSPFGVASAHSGDGHAPILAGLLLLAGALARAAVHGPRRPRRLGQRSGRRANRVAAGGIEPPTFGPGGCRREASSEPSSGGWARTTDLRARRLSTRSVERTE